MWTAESFRLVQSELFSHSKGPFTAALDQRIGRFDLAIGGAIFF
jgi:transcriptional regulator with GAF, ATPase, and Fis domain